MLNLSRCLFLPTSNSTHLHALCSRPTLHVAENWTQLIDNVTFQQTVHQFLYKIVSIHSQWKSNFFVLTRLISAKVVYATLLCLRKTKINLPMSVPSQHNQGLFNCSNIHPVRQLNTNSPTTFWIILLTEKPPSKLGSRRYKESSYQIIFAELQKIGFCTWKKLQCTATVRLNPALYLVRPSCACIINASSIDTADKPASLLHMLTADNSY